MKDIPYKGIMRTWCQAFEQYLKDENITGSGDRGHRVVTVLLHPASYHRYGKKIKKRYPFIAIKPSPSVGSRDTIAFQSIVK